VRAAARRGAAVGAFVATTRRIARSASPDARHQATQFLARLAGELEDVPVGTEARVCHDYVFTNTFSEEEARRLYERYHVLASGRVFWGSALANIHPGPDDTHVNYENPNRAPLLFISGSEDHPMPPSIQRSNAKPYKAEGTITEVVEYEGRAHLMPSQTGWEEVADYALSWAVEHAASWVAERGVQSTA
jgi:pimeloyl-ACP methyl ester carboxylesterase